jgi:ferrous iron transport protein A
MSMNGQQYEGQTELIPLGLAKRGFRGFIQRIEASVAGLSLPSQEIERRLIELGFLEGAEVSVLHEGLFGRDPIAVRVNGATVALRRKEAMAILTR